MFNRSQAAAFLARAAARRLNACRHPSPDSLQDMESNRYRQNRYFGLFPYNRANRENPQDRYSLPGNACRLRSGKRRGGPREMRPPAARSVRLYLQALPAGRPARWPLATPTRHRAAPPRALPAMATLAAAADGPAGRQQFPLAAAAGDFRCCVHRISPPADAARHRRWPGPPVTTGPGQQTACHVRRQGLRASLASALLGGPAPTQRGQPQDGRQG